MATFTPGLAHDASLPARARERANRIYAMAICLSKDLGSVRFLPRWIRTLHDGHSPLHDRLPWMNFKAIRWLDGFLEPTMRVFEYGAGGSTPFLAKRVRSLVTVEHDPRWVEPVAEVLRKDGLTNCELVLIPPVPDSSRRNVPFGPRSYTSMFPEAAGYSFEAYVRGIDAYPDRSFDLVIVDGTARPSAVAHAIPKVRHGGYLLLDDSDQPYSLPAVPLLAGFPRRDFVAVNPFQRYLQQSSVWQL